MKPTGTTIPEEKKPFSQGHVEHIKAKGSSGFRRPSRRRVKITVLGAGSVFTPRLINDFFHIKGLAGGTIALVDIDAARLSKVETVLKRIIARRGLASWSVVAGTDRNTLLAGTDYLINCIEVNGVHCVRPDYEIPLKYGVDQCIGDTAGPGGIMKALRTIPTWLEVLRDAERHCPGALVLNYTNPMNMLCLAAQRCSSMPVVGLCHSVQHTSFMLAEWAGIGWEALDYECAGINHLAWFTRLEHEGVSLYPRLMEKAREELRLARLDGSGRDLVRKDMMLRFGAYITESSGHLSEYIPYYRKRPDLIKEYIRPEYDGESGFYANQWPHWRRQANQEMEELLVAENPADWERTWEYASWIVEAIETNTPYRFHGNVANTTSGGGRLIGNLPQDGCVEVACLVDGNGVHPTCPGRLPAHMASLCAANMYSFEAAVTGIMECDRDAIVHAMLVDPLSAAVCAPGEIEAMALELFKTEADYLPAFMRC